MIARSAFAAMMAILSLTGCGGGNGQEPDVPQGRFPAVEARRSAPPVILTASGTGALEARLAGQIIRTGPCVYLEMGAEPALILWAENVRMTGKTDTDWAIETANGHQIRAGDRIIAGGGSLPAAQPIASFTDETVPEECALGDAVQVHSIESVERPAVDPAALAAPPPPPPPPSPQDDFLSGVAKQTGNLVGDGTDLLGFTDPREALLAHLLEEVRTNGAEHPAACIARADGALIDRLDAKFGDVHGAQMCRWKGGALALRPNDAPAMLISASLDCDGSRCVAEGSRVEANMGGEGHGYILRPINNGWRIQKVGYSWIS